MNGRLFTGGSIHADLDRQDAPRRMLRVGTDIGGTFTDLVLATEDGQVSVDKVLTVPDDQSLGFAAAMSQAVRDTSAVSEVTHGTTAGVNALLERKVPEVGLLCTAGHPDTLEIRRLWREHLFGNWAERPKALVPRTLRLEVRERLDVSGAVVESLDEESVRTAARRLWDSGVRSVAISFLHSYVNRKHERLARQIVLREWPEMQVTLSSDVLPEIGEYERTSTTVIAAMLRPVMSSYLSRLRRRLDELGADGAPVKIMRSSGALMTDREVISQPIASLNSGPAGGVRACAEVGRAMGAGEVLTFDMGGTSTEVCVIEGHRPLETVERDLEWNIPIRGPMLDIRSIGAGGGSIAWVDDGGALRVGPISAGAMPGPACYGRGGESATVTDAELVLGRIHASHFLGGRMRLEPARAEDALRKLPVPKHWDVRQTAEAVVAIALAQMALLLREMSVNRGYDPRDFLLMAFGGAGPLVAGELAAQVGIPRVCVPRHPSVLSALGGLMSDVTFDRGRTYVSVIDEIDESAVESLRRQLSDETKDAIAHDAVSDSPAEERYAVDIRYEGSTAALTVPLACTPSIRSDLEAASDEFVRRHRQLYGFDRPYDALEMTALRLRVISSREKPPVARWTTGGTPSEALERHQPVGFVGHDTPVETPVYRRDELGAGVTCQGPCLIEEATTVTVVTPDQFATIDAWGNVMIDVTDAARGESRG